MQTVWVSVEPASGLRGCRDPAMLHCSRATWGVCGYPDSKGEKTMASKPGERKLQILQTLAGMLEKPSAE
jgi:hypothetical protein